MDNETYFVRDGTARTMVLGGLGAKDNRVRPRMILVLFTATIFYDKEKNFVLEKM